MCTEVLWKERTNCFERVQVTGNVSPRGDRQETRLQMFGTFWMRRWGEERTGYFGFLKATDILIPREVFGRVWMKDQRKWRKTWYCGTPLENMLRK